jgi:hypothetical protein
MSAYLEALARRAVACGHWRWMPGMLTTDGLRILEGGTDYVIGHRFGETRRGGGWFDGESTGLLPDFSDPATLGCLLALVREAWGDPRLALVPMSVGRWAIQTEEMDYSEPACIERTGAEALVKALEAAP